MSKLILLVFLIFTHVAFSQTWKKIESINNVCPPNYILVPHLAPYTVRDFCVGKYENRVDPVSGAPLPSMTGTTVVNSTREVINYPFNRGVRANCISQGPNFNLISNDQWQTIAKNIAGVGSNWSSGVAYDGELNRGHSDNSPPNTLQSSTDDDPCFGTGDTCSATVWHSQRRTHTLSNGNIIWDFAGNVREFVTNTSSVSQGANDYSANFNSGDNRQVSYGHNLFCASPGITPYCGYGYGDVNYTGGAVSRGGYYADGLNAGVFSSYLNLGAFTTYSTVGSRCIYMP